MKPDKTFVSALALSAVLAVPMIADAADQERGNGNGRGQEARADRGNGNGNGNRGNSNRGNGNQGKGNSGQDRADNRGNSGAEARNRGAPQQSDRARNRPSDRRPNEVRDRDNRNDRPDPVRIYLGGDRDGNPGLINGCPPGLAKKNNGCLPPGQARQRERDPWDRYDSYWRRGDDRDRYRYRYNDGFLYRYDNDGSLMGWLPVLGGALGLGNIWPQQYSYQQPPQYYSQYYGLNDRYTYRYADGVLYGVDPQTQAIQQVAALLTGQQWTVGQAMPRGYDVYNVPYAYRGQYRDSPQAMYRYNDGYVYQVDPTTRLVQAVIQLLT